MTDRELLDRLAAHRTLGSAPRAELEWMIAHGAYRRLQAGELLTSKGAAVAGMHVVLSGRLALFVDRGAGPTKLIEWREGDVAGLLPYSRVVNAPGDAHALEDLEIFALPREQLQALTQSCYAITSLLVHTMLDRTRMFTAGDLQNEKMISLGKLSAGLAHELNNPASAIERSASGLRDRMAELESAAWELSGRRLSESATAALQAFCSLCQPDTGACDPMLQLDREEALTTWFELRRLDASSAATLAETQVTVEALSRLDAALDRPALGAALRWAVSGYAVRTLAGGIQDCSRRISRLVNAVKGFTHMDQANLAGAVQLGPTLRDTVTVLRSKAEQKGAIVTLELDAELPPARGFAGELNQVWGALLENALDAVQPGGRVEVLAAREGETVVVRVRDDGAGIPAEICDKIFDPFFTTKPQGEGIGLGLDIARRLVRHNDGAIEFQSQPGRTEFRVTLPLAEG